MREHVYVREWCDEKNVSQAELGRMTQLDNPHLCRISQRHKAFTETRKIIERALGLSPGDLLRDPRSGIDLAEVIKDPRIRVNGVPISEELKKALSVLIHELKPKQVLK